MQCPEAHLFCTSCMLTYAETKLGEHDARIVCMDQSGCKLPFPESELRRFLTPKLLELYERVKQRKEIEAAGIEGLEECPFCEYKVVIENEQERLFRCENEACGAVTCRKCKKPVRGRRPSFVSVLVFVSVFVSSQPEPALVSSRPCAAGRWTAVMWGWRLRPTSTVPRVYQSLSSRAHASVWFGGSEHQFETSSTLFLLVLSVFFAYLDRYGYSHHSASVDCSQCLVWKMTTALTILCAPIGPSAEELPRCAVVEASTSGLGWFAYRAP